MSFDYDPIAGATLGNSWASSREQAYWTDYRTGSLTIQRFTENVRTVAKTTVNLAAVSANATDLMGWFVVNSASGYGDSGVVAGSIHQLGGTVILMAVPLTMNPDNLDPKYSVYTTGYLNLASAILLTTYVEGGFIKAEIERYAPFGFEYPDGYQNTIGRVDISITYHAFALTFDN